MFKINKIEKSIQSIGTNFIWSNKIGVARTVLAMGTLFTLLFNDIHLVIEPLGEYVNREIHVNFSEYGIFQILKDNLVLAKLICIVILIVTASGWRPRITGILHAWVAFSVVSAFMVIDGGDQITSVLTLLLIPICLVDDRKWNWSTKKADEINDLQKHAGIIAAISYFFIRLQVAFIYFHAGVGKMDVEEWVNGTAIYYWSNSTIFKMPGWMESWLPTLFESATFMTLSTWGIMAFELLLFLGLAIENKWRPLLMKAGILFHFGIVLLYGLFSFFFAMTGALILYLGPKHGFKIPAIDINAILTKLKSVYKNKRPEISTNGSAV